MVRRYLLSFTLIIAIPIFLILVLFFRMFETTLVDNLSQQSLETAKQVAEGINEEAKRIAILASALANNQELLALAYTYNASTSSAEAYLASRRISSHFNILFNYLNQVGAVFLLFREKEILFHRNIPISLSPQYHQDPWYHDVLHAPGQTHILQIFSLDDEVNSGGLFLSCAICPGKEARANGLDMIVVSFKSQTYSDILLRQSRQSTGNTLIVNTASQVILDPDGMGKLYLTLPNFPPADGDQIITTPQGKWLVISSLMPYTGMRIVKMFEYDSLTGSIRKYARYAKIALLGLILLFFAYSGTFFRSIIRPLRKVILNMERVGQGNMNVQVKTEGLAELNHLCDAFNRMVEKIRLLTTQIEVKERQRAQAEIDSLQAQINPHFLSNTLNSIKMMAALVGADSIRKMTNALMSILTESFSSNGTLTSLDKEIANLEHYLYIMKVRFGDNFEMIFEIPGEIKALHLMKMLLQPILENAILHGIRSIDRKGDLKLAGWRQDQQLYLEVSDNGVGMSPETLQSIWENQAHPHKGLHGIGIRNVHERIRLNYGEPYGLTIMSAPAQGTVVTLVLPVIEGEDRV